MAANFFRSSKGASLIFLRLENNNVNFGKEQKYQNDRCAEACAQAKGDHFKIAAKVERYEREPNNARRVHAKADKFGFVEIFGQISRSHGVQRTQHDQKHIVADRSEHGPRLVKAHETCLVSFASIVDMQIAGLDYERRYDQCTLDRNYDDRDYYLSC